MTTDPLLLLLDDARTARYRPSLARALGGVLPAVLLQHLLDRWEAAGRRAVALCAGPGDDPRCRPGDSLEEVLGLAPEELEHARELLCADAPGGPVLRHWHDDEGAWYDLDAAALRALLGRALSGSGPAAAPAPAGPEPAEALLRRHLGRFYETMLSERPERRRAWTALEAETVATAAAEAQRMRGHYVTRLRERLDELAGLEPARPTPRGSAPEPGPPEVEAADSVFEAEADPVALARFLGRTAPELREATLERLGPELRDRVEDEIRAQETRRREEAERREEDGRARRQAQAETLLRTLAARMDLASALPPADDPEDADGERDDDLLDALVEDAEDAP